MRGAKKIINDSTQVVPELLAGLVSAYGGEVKMLKPTGALVKAKLPPGKVGLLIGGGSGHEPLFPGFIGENLADGAACGHIFAAPTPDVILAATRVLDQGKGVLYIYGNYAGDNLNFDMAAKIAADEGITTKTVRVWDDVAEGIQANTDLLTQADKAIGDGDHGLGMARGFAAVQRSLADRTFVGLDELFQAIAATLITSVGGAAGAIFATFFRGGARNLAGRQRLDAAALADMLSDGLRAVVERGKAQPGDKTAVDALAPAAQRARELRGASLAEALDGAAAAAQEGVEATKAMVARVGKAKTLGERSLGYPDPGALSAYLILKLMSEYVGGMQ
ncbi:MAG: dihydroxyacetone kinase subunit DhaL [Anaerolineae bacterium]